MKMKNTVKTLVLNSHLFPQGIKACIVLNTWGSVGQHYCGYLELPETYGTLVLVPQSDIDVHGGVTYDELSEDGKRIIGFDCGHSCDYTPYKAEWHKSYASHHMFMSSESAPMSAMNFRTQTYVINELRRLVSLLETDSLFVNKSL